MEQNNKVAKLNEDQVEIKEAEIDGGVGDDDEISDMDKLPNEMLTKILDYLDEEELVKCRLLSTRWNEICCLLLQDKSYATITTLGEFIKFFGPSKAEKSSGRRRPFPFSCFNVQSLRSMDVTQICKFVSTFGPRMKSLTLDVKQLDIPNFVRFWKLLLHFAPNIQQLKLSGDSSLKDVILFDPIYKFIAESDPNFKVVNPNDTFLKNLIKLEIVSPNFAEFNGFMTELLDNTPNLQEVSSAESDPNGNYVFQHLEIWQKLNKAHLLKNLEMKINSSKFIHSNLSPAQLMKNLRLVNLRADCSPLCNSKDVEKSTTNYINHALKSSQKTLSSLDLQSLSVENTKLCLKDISSLPNVRQLNIYNIETCQAENIVQQFSQRCPNVTSLNLRNFYGDFSKAAPILWTRFQGLKFLELAVNMTHGFNNSLALDSAISGYSTESIEKIQSKLNQGSSLEEARRGEAQNTSILDLKELRRLELGFSVGQRTDDMEQGEVEKQLRNSIFVKILPQHIRDYPESISYNYW